MTTSKPWRPGPADRALRDVRSRRAAPARVSSPIETDSRSVFSPRRPSAPVRMRPQAPGAAYYARGTSGWRAWWTLLHPPYTLMHLSFVVVGAALAPRLHWDRLGWTLLAFFLAMGLAAHALDELKGRPLGTRIPAAALVTLSVVALAGATGVGVWGMIHYGLARGLWFIPLGVLLVVGYNLEIGGGVVHNGFIFAAAWGAFPALVASFAQTGTLTLVALAGATYAFAASHLQRVLSTEARHLRRHAADVDGVITTRTGAREPIDRTRLLATPEAALRGLVVLCLLVAGLLVLRGLTAP